MPEPFASNGWSPLRDDDAAQTELEEAAQRQEPVVAGELVEERELGLPEDLHPRRDDAVEVADEREPGLLDAGVHDGPVEARGAGDEREIDAEPLVGHQARAPR